jgi:hypothetical protein
MKEKFFYFPTPGYRMAFENDFVTAVRHSDQYAIQMGRKAEQHLQMMLSEARMPWPRIQWHRAKDFIEVAEVAIGQLNARFLSSKAQEIERKVNFLKKMKNRIEKEDRTYQTVMKEHMDKIREMTSELTAN